MMDGVAARRSRCLASEPYASFRDRFLALRADRREAVTLRPSPGRAADSRPLHAGIRRRQAGEQP